MFDEPVGSAGMTGTPPPRAFGIRRMAGLVGSAGVTALLTIGYIVYVGRVLGREEYADFAAALSVIYIVGVALSPLTPTVGRLVARYKSSGDHGAVATLRKQLIVRTGILATVMAVFGAALSPFLSELLRFRTPAPLALAFVVVSLFTIVSVDRGVVHGLLQFRVHNLNTMMEAALRAAGALVLFAFWTSATAALLSYVLALAVAELVLAARLGRRSREAAAAPVDWGEIRELGVPIIILMFAIAALQNVDMLVVKRYFTRETSGSYGAATALARSIGVMFVPLYVAIGPILTSMGRRDLIFAATARMTAIFLSMSALVVVVMLAWPATIVRLLYGEDFAAAASLLAPLTGVAAITYGGLMLSQALITVREFRFLTIYGVSALLQIGALLMHHDNLSMVVQSLYVVQGGAFVTVAAVFVLAARKSREMVAG